MIENLIKITCNICGESSTGKSIKDLNWTEIEVDCKYVDRMWNTYHICQSCTKLILAKNLVKS